MKYADLHIHSSYSDGCKTPEEIIDSAIKNKIKYISITDHDSISSQYVTRNSYDDLVIIPTLRISPATIGTIATCTWIGLGVLIQKFYLRHFLFINIILALTFL